MARGSRFVHSRYIAAIILIALWIYLRTAARTDAIITESIWLAKHMNSNPPASSKKAPQSSFDWSSVKYEYPPDPPRALPKVSGLGLPSVQHRFPLTQPGIGELLEARRGEVRNLFLRDWKAYKQYAWKKDALKPISGGFQDQFSGWAATLVDTLDTLWIMGLREEFDKAVDAVVKIDFGSSTSSRVNMFETNIRYLGGLLAAYDLSKREALLTKAIELGDLLYCGFNTENRMPVDFMDFDKAKTGQGLSVEGSVVSASPGTLSLELTRLSQVTGDPKYYTAISKVMELFRAGQKKTDIPGLWPMMVSMSRLDVTSGGAFSIAGSADSLYEYLPKMYGLMQGSNPIYKDMTIDFLDAANKHMLFRPMLPDNQDILLAGTATSDRESRIIQDPEVEHLSCYIGGAFALSGRLLDSPKYVDIGELLTKGCIYSYTAMPSGVGPERYNMVLCESRQSCPWSDKIWDEEKQKRHQYKEHLPKGFTTAKDPRYILRPEAIESVFLLYRITGNQEYQEAAWKMFKSVRAATDFGHASSSVRDVTRPIDPSQNEDYMESFWYAETLKYFYLAFSPPDVISLDEYVFNTEAHPFLRAKV